jgi:signal transduction histidine kinase
MTGVTTSSAAALLESMRVVEQALAQPSGLASEQVAARLREWQRLVIELGGRSEQRTELTALYETIKVLNSSLDLGETLNLVMDALIQMTGAERSCLMLLDGEGNLEIQAARHFDQKSIPPSDLELSRTVVRNAVEGGEAVLTTNAQIDPRFSDQESVVGYHLRSIVCVPLHVRERVIGALYLDNRMRNGVFSHSTLPMLTAFANQAAVAIENARLFEAERKQREMTEALGQAAAVVNSTLDLDQVLDRIQEQVKRVVPGDTFNIMLLEDDDDTVRMVRRWGYEHQDTDDQMASLRIPTAKFPNLAKMMQTGKPVVVPNTATDPWWVLEEGREWLRSYVAAPIHISGRTVGFLNVNSIHPGQFSPSDARRLELLAHHAATAIQNARLYQQVRRHADELAAAVARLRELDRLKSEFIQNVSHELRTPLAVIQGYAALLEEGELGELQSEQQETVSTICRRVQMLRDMVEDITLILGVESGSLESLPVWVGELVRTAVEGIRPVAEQSKLTLQTTIPPDLPPVCGSPVYLQRTVDNLLNNAVKFTPEEGTIAVRAWQEGNQIVLQVADTGIGIPPDQHGRIFDRFYQVDGSSSRRYGGMGLGLALVKEVVEAHGGTVRIESAKGKGSTFTITLPVSTEQSYLVDESG